MEEFDKKTGRNMFSRVGMAFSIMLVVTFAVQTVTMLVFKGWILEHRQEYDGLQVLFASLPMYMVAVPACVYCFSKIPATKLEVSSWKMGKLFIVFLICFGLMYSSNMIGVSLMYGVGALRGRPVINDMSSLIEMSYIWPLVLCIVILAPIIEEFLFRKLLIDRIYPYGEKLCVLVSGILFGLMHGNFYQFFYAFVLGAVFGYIYVKTGRLRYSIIFHMIINFQGSVISVGFIRHMTSIGILENPMMVYQHFTSVLMILGYVGLVLVCAIAGMILLFCNLKKISFRPGNIQIPKGQRFQTVFLNVGMLLFLALGIIRFGMSLR